MKLIDLLFMANYLVIVFVSKMLLAGIPNVQITFLLMLLFIVNFKFQKYWIFLISFVILEFLAWGYFTLIFPALFVWLMLYMLYKLFNSNSINSLITIAVLFTPIHALTYAVHDIVLGHIGWEGLVGYLIAGIPFAIVFLASSILSVIWLFDPLNKLIQKEKEVWKEK
jgi:hypothetical protein